ncbi:MAG: phosphodiester glycosidase family protein [Gemmatimonadaceae bacterium]|nr:phosphodiester glycosidase family protein [Gemmatimonadaceae bacterium]
MRLLARLLWAAALPCGVAAQSAPAARITSIRCDTTVKTAAPRLSWRGDVVQWAEWRVVLGERGVRNRVIVVRMPASRVRFTLEIARRGDQMLPWSLDDAPADAQIAVNAGQFTDVGPWGWVVHKQRELQPPGVGPLAGAFVVDSAGAVALLTPDEIDAWRVPGRVVEAVQSYPMLLTDNGRPPRAMCSARGGLDLAHRDTRLAIGITGDAHVLFVLTRYEAPAVCRHGFPSAQPRRRWRKFSVDLAPNAH